MSILSSTSSGKAAIEAEWRKYGINPNLVTVNPDGTLDYNGNLYLTNSNKERWRVFNPEPMKLPFQFNTIHGNFDCSFMGLTTLEGAPKVVEGYFDCCSNRLDSLKHGPEFVLGSYMAQSNRLKDFNGVMDISSESYKKHAAEYMDRIQKNCQALDVSYNLIESLKGAPVVINGNLDCRFNALKSIKGCPKKLNYLMLSDNKFLHVYIKHLPEKMNAIYMSNNGLTWRTKNRLLEYCKSIGMKDNNIYV